MPSPDVQGWLARQDREKLHTTAITEAEIFLGLELMPKGQRGYDLEKATRRMFQVILSGRVLPFDRAAAHAYALVVAERQRLGRPIKQPDAQIAAIARSRGASLATRNVRDFEHCGINVINPWTD
jgi:predicted nucleic acid-binding protein